MKIRITADKPLAIAAYLCLYRIGIYQAEILSQKTNTVIVLCDIITTGQKSLH